MKASTTKTTAKKARPKAVVVASDVMQRQIVTVSPDAPLSEVERLLTENRISGMPVTDTSGRAIGVISYRDLLDHYAENPESRPRRGPGFFHLSSEELDDEDTEAFSVPEESEDIVEDAMTPEVIHVRSDAPLAEVARTMVRRNVHRVLVTDRKTGGVVGIISSMAVLAGVAR